MEIPKGERHRLVLHREHLKAGAFTLWVVGGKNVVQIRPLVARVARETRQLLADELGEIRSILHLDGQKTVKMRIRGVTGLWLPE